MKCSERSRLQPPHSSESRAYKATREAGSGGHATNSPEPVSGRQPSYWRPLQNAPRPRACSRASIPLPLETFAQHPASTSKAAVALNPSPSGDPFKTPPRPRKRSGSFSLSHSKPLQNAPRPRMCRRVLIPLLGERVRACPGRDPGVRGLPRTQPRVTQRSPRGEGWGEGLPRVQLRVTERSPLGEGRVRIFRATNLRVTQRSLKGQVTEDFWLDVA